MRKIKLRNDYVALVDLEDYKLLKKHKWSLFNGDCGLQYAVRWIRERGKKRKVIFMHRQIMGENDGCIDHKNGNGLDNRKENLRICTHAQNMRNRKMHKNNKSGFKGVRWRKNNQNWAAEIRVNGKSKWLGVYASKLSAAIAYNKGAIIYHGEFARLNQI
jgi:hypothetical protein